MNPCRCANTRFRRGINQESIECWAYPRSMPACANKRCSIGWNPSSSQYSMMRVSDIGEGGRQKMHYARSGRRFKAGRSGSWMRTSEIFFGSVDHEKLLTLVAQRVADGRVLRLIKAMLKAGNYGKGQVFPSQRGTPQGGVVSPTLSNILLTPFDREMRLRGYQLTRYADDWVITCKSVAEARAAVDAARRILKQLGVELHPQKTRIVHVRYGFEFLGYKIKRRYRKLHLPERKIRRPGPPDALDAYPKEKSIRRFMDQVRQRTKRPLPLKTEELITELNPLLRGWGEYYKRAHVRQLFNRLDRWILRRIWSHRCKRWRRAGWRWLPRRKLYGEYGLVRLAGLIPSLAIRRY